MTKSKYAITVEKLHKSYGGNHVLQGIDFKVERGGILALLGPNGAGKTTAVKILSTLLPADSGTVKIEGRSVSGEPHEVRKLIGLTGQSASIDELLTGRENLVMMGRLYRLTKRSAIARADELLTEFDLQEAADRPTKTYSGGMRRRLDLAVSLIATPPIVFLDEPTTGLDPRSRLVMWDIIKKLVADGATILLTTQYLEEADQLADKIMLIDNGKVIASGTAKELKLGIGKDMFVLTFATPEKLNSASKVLGKKVVSIDETNLQLSVGIKSNGSDVKNVLDQLAKESVSVAAMDIHKPTLDDVFMSLTEQKGK